MGKSNDFDEAIEEYEEYDYDDFFDEDDEIEEDLEVVDEEFQGDIEDESYEDLDDGMSKINFISILSVFSVWFIRVGIILMIFLVIMFFVTGKVLNAFLYIGGLILAFFFGYFFMFCLDGCMSRRVK